MGDPMWPETNAEWFVFAFQGIGVAVLVGIASLVGRWLYRRRSAEAASSPILKGTFGSLKISDLDSFGETRVHEGEVKGQAEFNRVRVSKWKRPKQ